MKIKFASRLRSFINRHLHKMLAPLFTGEGRPYPPQLPMTNKTETTVEMLPCNYYSEF